MLWTILGAALAGTATLHVGVHRQAGGVYDIAADGAAGLCTAHPARITCPADGPVSFRWAAGGDWVLVGQTEVAPGEVGVAWVLATEESRAEQLSQLSAGVDRDLIQLLYAPAPGVPPTPPSLEMIRALERLARHPDPSVRRAVVDGLVPLWRHTASDPFPAAAPELLEDGLITLLSKDPDVRVRRRLATRLRELRNPSVAQREEAIEALERLLNDTKPPVQKAATSSTKLVASRGITPGEEAWVKALERVPNEGPPGRAACNTLAFLAKNLEPSDVVVPLEAVHQVMQYHPERAWSVWAAWKEKVGFDRDRLLTLLHDTVGLHRGLLRYFAEERPDELALALRDWEPDPPHSERYQMIRTWLADVEAPAIRRVLDAE